MKLTDTGEYDTVGVAVGIATPAFGLEQPPNEGSGTSVSSPRLAEDGTSPDASSGGFSLSAIYGAVPVALFENASYGQVRVYAALSSFQGTKAGCYPSVEQISDRAHVTGREVHRALNWLEEKGWISRIAAPGKRNQYNIHRESLQLNNTPPTPDMQVTPDAKVTADVGVTPPLTPTPQAPDAPVRSILKEQEKNIEKTNAYTIKDFSAFWDRYPRRVGKKAALGKFKVARKSASQEDIMDGLEKYREEIRVKRTDTQYIAHPATWLNQGRWEDEDETSEDEDHQWVLDEEHRWFYYGEDNEKVYEHG